MHINYCPRIGLLFVQIPHVRKRITIIFNIMPRTSNVLLKGDYSRQEMTAHRDGKPIPIETEFPRVGLLVTRSERRCCYTEICVIRVLQHNRFPELRGTM